MPNVFSTDDARNFRRYLRNILERSYSISQSNFTYCVPSPEMWETTTYLSTHLFIHACTRNAFVALKNTIMGPEDTATDKEGTSLLMRGCYEEKQHANKQFNSVKLGVRSDDTCL